MMTSGAPEPASIAVENLVYSSLPWPALVQQIWTSSWVSLNRSTTCFEGGVPGPDAHLGGVGVRDLVGAAAASASPAGRAAGQGRGGDGDDAGRCEELSLHWRCSFLSRCWTPLSACDRARTAAPPRASPRRGSSLYNVVGKRCKGHDAGRTRPLSSGHVRNGCGRTRARRCRDCARRSRSRRASARRRGGPFASMRSISDRTATAAISLAPGVDRGEARERVPRLVEVVEADHRRRPPARAGPPPAARASRRARACR